MAGINIGAGEDEAARLPTQFLVERIIVHQFTTMLREEISRYERIITHRNNVSRPGGAETRILKTSFYVFPY